VETRPLGNASAGDYGVELLASVRIDVEKSAYHHVSQSKIDALAQGIVEIVVRIGELQRLKAQRIFRNVFRWTELQLPLLKQRAPALLLAK
jgi:hypothetical protein